MCDDPIAYRPAEPGDRQAIETILVGALKAYGIDLQATYSFKDITDIQQAYMDSGGIFMVLTLASRLIGYFGLVPGGGSRVKLKRLYLDAAVRGKGFGDHILRQAMQTARQMGFTAMHLETTSKFKEALGLYRKHGFVYDPAANVSAGHDVALMKVL